MDRLSGLDASFLYLETPAQLMHVCGLFVLDPSTMPEPYSFRRVQDQIEQAVRDVPTFTPSCAASRSGSTTPCGCPTAASTSSVTSTASRCRPPAATRS